MSWERSERNLSELQEWLVSAHTPQQCQAIGRDSNSPIEGRSRPAAGGLWPQVEDQGTAYQTEAEAWRHECNQHSGREHRKNNE